MSSRCSLSSFRTSLSTLNSAVAELPTGRKGTQAQNRKVQSAALAVITNAKNIRIDPKQTGDVQLVELAKSFRERLVEVQKGGGFERWFGKSLTEKLSLSALQAIDPVAAYCKEACAKEREEGCFQARIDLLERARDPGPQAFKKRIDVYQSRFPLLFSDPDFVFEFFKSCAKNHPEFLCDNLDAFKIALRNGEEIEQVGARIEDPNHREKFCAHFGCSAAVIYNAREEYLKNEKEYDRNLLGGRGNCLGYTVAYIAKKNQTSSPEEISRLARFVQVGYGLNRKATECSPEMLNYIGNAVINDDLWFAIVEPQKVLGDEGAKHPHLVGKFVVNLYKKLSSSEAELIKGSYRLLDGIKEKTSEVKRKQKLISFYEAFPAKNDEQLEIIRSHKADVVQIENEIIGLDEEFKKREMHLKFINLLRGLFKSAKEASPSPKNRESVPQPIMKTLGLKEQSAILSTPQPLEELSKYLFALKDREGGFKIQLIGTPSIVDGGNMMSHAIELSFKPAYFRDPNDIDPHTLEPRKRSFAGVSEMVIHLRKQLAYTYSKELFPTFNITPYESAPDADEVAEWLL